MNAGKKRSDDTRYWNRLLGLLSAVGSVVLFVLTENVHDPMILTDRWTPAMLALLCVELGLAYLTRKEKRENA